MLFVRVQVLERSQVMGCSLSIHYPDKRFDCLIGMLPRNLADFAQFLRTPTGIAAYALCPFSRDLSFHVLTGATVLPENAEW